MQLRPQLGVLLPQLRCSIAPRSTRESCDSWNGLIRKSTAPRLMAVTASLTPPNPVITTARIVGNSVNASSSRSSPLASGSRRVDDERVVGEAVQTVAPIGGIRRLRHSEPVGLETVGDHLPQRRVVLDQEYGEASRFSHGRGEPGQRP